jgi:hypothetical protein
MTPVLSPQDALDYLAQLSTDVRCGAVLDGSGELLAGAESCAAPARELLAASDAAEIEVTTRDGVVFAARSATHAVVVVCGTFALSGLQRHDLRTVLGDLASGEAAA